jgi:Uma2 family endonuclease
MFKINYSILSIIIISIIIGLTSIGFLEYKKHMINYKKLENNMNKNKEQINKCSIILDNLLNNIKQKSKNKKNIEEDVMVVEEENNIIEKEEDVIVVEEENNIIEKEVL